ncbi:patatin-like phospholipase family protein [Salegentibacter sp. JZCK2]|uniref:patatin-like phospholipase family protein n=1 Tax=Salegentibacter tibetensis TaxID=2873600 RepID=UPI001CCF9304|nr:patatin-like phospholipase family protein [Salegentibacter tibetensis]MBZ9728235.1 patatin-like phospholipase family protein [Salegentibacter tibetensis]
MKKLLLLIFLLLTLPGISQQQEDLKVGLVLSGGGAKGLAHIGALKVIEDAGIRIDYIGGSSMGAIIGGLYASGYTAHQLDSIFHETNFNILIQDNIPRSAKSFYEKEDSEKYALSLPFDNFKIGFPSGLSRGQNIYNLISQLTMHLGNVDDFSELPIPFFCIAADVETGEEVILDEGSLAQAVSASGAIPSLFSPVSLNGRLLTDGGVANNYPVEELRKRGAEVIIGVDVQDSLVNREELRNVFDILTQISNFRTISEMKEKIPKTDIYIKPDISPFSVLSFEKGKAIIDSGRVASLKRREELEKLAERQSAERQEVVMFKIDTLQISTLTLEGNNTYPRSYIMGKLRLNYFTHFTFEDLNRGINNLSATGNFNKVNYRLIPNNDDGLYTLAMKMEESENKSLLRLGLHYDELYKIGALINYTRNSLLFSNDVASLDVVVGEQFRYNFDYYIDKGFYWSIGFKSRYNNFDHTVSFDFARENAELEDIGVNRIDIDYRDFTNQFYAETLFQQVFSFGLGAEHKYLRIASETLNNPNPEFDDNTLFENSHYYSAFGYLKYDSYDNKYFPSRGVYFDGDFHVYLFSSDFNNDFAEFSIAKGTLGYAFSPINKFSARIVSEAGFKIGSDGVNTLDFFLGGYGNNLINNFVPFYGYDFISLSGDSYIKGLVELDYEIFRKHHLIASANIANVGNKLYSSGDWFTMPDFTGYALGYGVDTFIGPLEVKYTYSPEIKASQWFFSLGFWF